MTDPHLGQSWMFGANVIEALIAEGLVPPTTSKVTVVVEGDEYVRLHIEAAFSVEQLRRLGARLRTDAATLVK